MERKKICPVVYVAGPFRGPNHWEIEQNIRRAEALALDVWRIGCAVICPHSNTRFYQGAAPDDVWLQGDLEMMARCDYVLMTEDWQRSSGARAEHQYALENGQHIVYSIDELIAALNENKVPCLVCGDKIDNMPNAVQVCVRCLIP